MNERWLISSFTASSLIHLSLIPMAALIIHSKPFQPITVPIELVDGPRLEQPKQFELPPPPPPAPKNKPANIVAPKLSSKPVLETSSLAPTGNTKEAIIDKPLQEPKPLASLPDTGGAAKAGWNTGSKSSEVEGSAAGTGNLYNRGDVGVVGGSSVSGGGGGTGNSGLGGGAKGDGTGGGTGSGEALSGLARPLGGYQVKPRYPDAAKRAGAQGVTTLRVQVLENGRVGEVLIDQSAGYRELDLAAMDAVKKWLFEPARRGKEEVSVWVMLPVKFELR